MIVGRAGGDKRARQRGEGRDRKKLHAVRKFFIPIPFLSSTRAKNGYTRRLKTTAVTAPITTATPVCVRVRKRDEMGEGVGGRGGRGEQTGKQGERRREKSQEGKKEGRARKTENKGK